jgi:hypothetical protein
MGKIATRFAVVLGVMLTFAVATSVPASAHTISGPRPTNFRSRVLSITPPVPDVLVRIVDLGGWVELTNHSAEDVIVLGYQNEAYLRIGRSGVFENLESPSTYINRSSSGTTSPEAASAKLDAPPRWHRISSARSARFHYHPTHWMGGQLPPQVQSDPAAPHHIGGRWHIPLRVGDAKVDVEGVLDWVPGPSGAPWIPVGIGVFVLGAAAAFGWRRPQFVVGVLGVLVVADAAHAITYELGRSGSTATRLGEFFGGNFVSIFVWIAAVVTSVGLARRRPEALFGAAFVGLLAALVGGATDLSALTRSQLLNVGPPWLTRAEVVVALALGSGVVVGAIVGAVRADRAESGARPWLELLVEGLDDDELLRVTAELDVDEVLGAALSDLATRAAPIADAFMAGSVAFDVGISVWSLVAVDGAWRARRGRLEPVVAEIRTTFPVLLQVLAGTRPFDRDAVTGDAQLVECLVPYLAEVTPASAS